MIGSCARCQAELALHLGRPRVLGDGRVALFCAACWDRRDQPVVVAPIAIAPRLVHPRPRITTRLAVAAVALAIGAGGIAIATHETTPAAAALPIVDVRSDEPTARRSIVTEEETVADGARLDPAGARELAGSDVAVPPVTLIDDEPIEERFPTLRDWVHPVTDSSEPVPVRAARKFGARRIGIDRAECGGGHCGLDLAGPRGRPVVAVAWGTVVRVEHSENGRDGKTGRYVRIEHPDGVFTAYMHLDAIAQGLAVGDEVEAGRVLGTLGKTAIHAGEEHLHFALEITLHGQTRFIDPTPFLSAATIAPIPARAEAAIDPADRSQW